MDEQRLERALREGPPFTTRYAPAPLALDDELVARYPASIRRLAVLIAVAALLLVAMLAAFVALSQPLPRPDPLPWPLGALAYNVDGDIYIVPAEGEAPVLVADGTWNEYGYWDPHWSPDGQYLMYHETWRNGSLVHVLNTEGQEIASFPGWYSTWAPDSSRLATWGEDVFGTVDIRAPDGRLLASVTIPNTLQGSGDQRPGWSPDGSAIILPRYYFAGDGLPDGAGPVVLPIDGGAPRRLSVEVTGGYDAAFSPDGRRIAIDAPTGLFLTSADGTGAQLLAKPDSGFYAEPLWSPSGDRIAVTTRHLGEGLRDGSIQVIDLATGTALTVLSLPDTEGAFYAQDWSPDGQTLLVQIWGAGPDGHGSLWSAAADGSGFHVLVERAYEGADWFWPE
jgi:hypothetical protein